MKISYITTIFVGIALTVSGMSVHADELELAYQKEYAYLEAQQRNLMKRLEEFKAESQREKRAQSKQLDALSRDLLVLKNESVRINDLVFESERTLEETRDNRELFESTFEQAMATLKQNNMPVMLGDEQPADQRMQVIYNSGMELLSEVSGVSKDKGIFFDADGRKVTGDIYRLGQIAAIGVSDTAKGLLVPAGEGRLKLWSEDPGMADYMVSNVRPDTARLFIYESSVKSIDTEASESMLAYVNSGGIIAWVIVILGVIAGLLIVIRTWFLRAYSTDTDIIIDEIKKPVAKHEIDAAVQVCKQHKGSAARVITATLRNLERDRDHLEDIVAENILYESPKIDRFSALIIVIAAVAPLLGLLGTVTGMISTFDVITQYGTGDPKLLSGGISTALVTTQLGLVVAIPVLILGNLLSGWSNRIKDDMEKAALQIINIYDAPESIKRSDYLSLAQAV